MTGTLRPGATFHPDDWRGEYFTLERLAEVERRVEPLRQFLNADTPTLALLALRFCLHHPAVASVLPGMRRLANLESNMTAPDGVLPAETLAALRAYDWDHGWAYPWAVSE